MLNLLKKKEKKEKLEVYDNASLDIVNFRNYLELLVLIC